MISSIFVLHVPKEEGPCVKVGPPWLNKVESESESIAPFQLWSKCLTI